MIRWGVIGAGGFADARSIPGLKQSQSAHLQAVMVRDASRAAALAQKHGAHEAYDTVEALVASPNVDAVYVCTPVDLHPDHVEMAAAAGKHVLCEKPMALTVAQCQQMIETCRRHGVQLAVGYMVRYRPHCQMARRLIDQGRLGRIVAGRAQTVLWHAPSPTAWRHDPQ
ncbi:MAG: Gfo/Idh/MocA family oxidoreductase, partial [Chloroflexi bacterium]|nr:Gfo/Idh/MocA family oxidoreductase [Chloroflexota bacterium]